MPGPRAIESLAPELREVGQIQELFLRYELDPWEVNPDVFQNVMAWGSLAGSQGGPIGAVGPDNGHHRSEHDPLLAELREDARPMLAVLIGFLTAQHHWRSGLEHTDDEASLREYERAAEEAGRVLEQHPGTSSSLYSSQLIYRFSVAGVHYHRRDTVRALAVYDELFAGRLGTRGMRLLWTRLPPSLIEEVNRYADVLMESGRARQAGEVLLYFVDEWVSMAAATGAPPGTQPDRNTVEDIPSPCDLLLCRSFLFDAEVHLAAGDYARAALLANQAMFRLHRYAPDNAKKEQYTYARVLFILSQALSRLGDTLGAEARIIHAMSALYGHGQMSPRKGWLLATCYVAHAENHERHWVHAPGVPPRALPEGDIALLDKADGLFRHNHVATADLPVPYFEYVRVRLARSGLNWLRFQGQTQDERGTSLAKAEVYCHEAFLYANLSGLPILRTAARLELANALFLQGQHAEQTGGDGREKYRSAWELCQQLDQEHKTQEDPQPLLFANPFNAFVRWVRRARLADAVGQPWPVISEAINQAVKAFRTYRRTAPVNYCNLHIAGDQGRWWAWAIERALREGAGTAFETMQRVKGGLLADVLGSSLQASAPPPQAAEALSQCRRDFVDCVRHARPGVSDATGEAFTNELARRMGDFLAVWQQAELMSEGRNDSRPVDQHQATSSPRPLDLQGAIPDGWAVIEFCTLNRGTLGAFVLRKGSLEFKALGSLDQLGTVSEDVRLWHSYRIHGTDGKSALRQIDDVLLKPLREAGLLDGLRGVYITPSAALAHLPLHAGFYQGVGHLFEAVEVAYLPASFLLPDLIPYAPRSGPTLTLANPERGSGRSLPFSEWQANVLNSLLHSQSSNPVISGPSARIGSLAASGNHDVLHLACHALSMPSSNLFAHLVLADDLLLAHDILHRSVPGMLPLRPGTLVVLGACSSADADVRAEEESLGLMTAFLAAGAVAVLAASWPVDDLCTALVSSEFLVQVCRHGRPPAVALRLALDHVRNEVTAADVVSHCDAAQRYFDEAGSGSEYERRLIEERRRQTVDDIEARGPASKPFRHPFYWASYRLIGRVTA